MKANELRIGNWITLVKDDIYENKDYQLEAYDIYKASEFDDITQCLLPIPITEEWLLKFGYTFKSYGYGDGEWKQWSFNGYSLNSFTCNKTGVDLKYVHQLQNLYFALTGEELKIK